MGFSAIERLENNLSFFEREAKQLREKKESRDGEQRYNIEMFQDDLLKASFDGIVIGIEKALKFIEDEGNEKKENLEREDLEDMAKKPFAIRVEPSVSTRFRALSIVLSKDGAPLLAEMIGKREMELTTDERNAYEMLLKLWESQEEEKNKGDE